MGLFDFLKGKKKGDLSAGSHVVLKEMDDSPVVPTASVKVSLHSAPPAHDYDADVVPVEKIIPTLKPNEAGLYPHEILALEYAGKYRAGENKFAGFWWYRYGVKDMNALMQSLINRGFIRIGSIAEGLQLYKLDELKNVLSAHNLKVTGKKADLIARLLGNVSEQELQEFFPHRPYVLTESGKDAIKYDEYVLYAHQHQYEGIDIYSLNRMIDGHTKTYRDYIWRHFNEKSMEYVRQSNYSAYRYIRFQMAQFVMEEGKYDQALMLLTEFVLWATSGLDYGPLNIESAGRLWFPYENSMIRIPPGVVKVIAECRDKLGTTDEEFRQSVMSCLLRLTVPFHVFEKEEVLNILMMELQKDTEGLEKMYKAAKERIKREFPGMGW